MENASHQVAPGYNAYVHFRAPSDLMPAVHAYARRRGLTSASWLRMTIIEALGTATPEDPGTGHQQTTSAQ